MALGGFSISLEFPKLHRIIANTLVSNGGFETATGDDFSSWTEDTDGGNCTITAETTTIRSGSKSCKILSNAGGDVEGSVYQDIAVEERTSYQIEFWSRCENEYASMQGRYAIYDNSGTAWVVYRKNTGAFSSSAWIKVTDIFTTPAGCTSIRLYLYQNIDSGAVATSAVYYDDVAIYKRRPVTTGLLPDFGGASDISSYNHTISAIGGFDTMSFTTAGDSVVMSDWMDNALGRNVVATGPSGSVIWEGFVNKITIRIGGNSIEIGPLTDVTNMGRIIYTTIDWATTPPVRGERVKSPWRLDTDSYAKYYVLQGHITGGEGTASEMDTLLSSLMQSIAWPPASQTFSIGAAGSISITVDCLGFSHLLDHWFYEQTQVAGTYSLSTKIYDILAADPNHIIDVDVASIETNATSVPKYEDSDKTAFDQIKELASMGDDSYNRYIFGVYESAFFVYEMVAEELAYIRNISGGDVFTPNGALVEPWDVRPGKWVLTADTPGANVKNFRHDPRYTFIESLSFNAPYSLQVTGGRADTLKQRIERMGLGGIA